MKLLLVLLPFATALVPACSDRREAPVEQALVLPESQPPVPEFGTYWFQGKAELCRYRVEQSRYGEMREAQQVMIFVTEDFSAERHVKLDNPEQAGADRAPVLKCNWIRRFPTGIYDYSIMQSVFTPYDENRFKRTLKTTTTIQDWCGHVFMQLDAEGKGYKTRHFSYFESEGDMETSLPIAVLEDELWNRIRINPATVPTGKVQVIPSAVYCRLLHKPMLARMAEITVENRDSLRVLQLRYTDIPRTLTIRFQASFPFRIIGWEETDSDTVLSRGELVEHRMEPYWQLNGRADSTLRQQLGVQWF